MIGTLLVLCFVGPIAAQRVSDKCECGVENIQTRIIGGGPSQPNRYPWMAAIVTPNDPNDHYCGGTLITDRHILTAGHCVSDMSKDNVGVVLGAHKLSEEVTTLSVSNVDHDMFNPNWGSYDYAILTLSFPVNFTRKVSPICLPGYNDVLDYTNMFVTGWGRVHPTEKISSDVLKEVSVPEVDIDTCRKRHRKDHISAEYQICAGEKDSDACLGDSGGPLQTRVAGHVYQVGIVSFGSPRGCAYGIPTVYTRVSAYMSMIKRKLNEGTTCSSKRQ